MCCKISSLREYVERFKGWKPQMQRGWLFSATLSPQREGKWILECRNPLTTRPHSLAHMPYPHYYPVTYLPPPIPFCRQEPPLHDLSWLKRRFCGRMQFVFFSFLASYLQRHSRVCRRAYNIFRKRNLLPRRRRLVKSCSPRAWSPRTSFNHITPRQWGQALRHNNGKNLNWLLHLIMG